VVAQNSEGTSYGEDKAASTTPSAFLTEEVPVLLNGEASSLHTIATPKTELRCGAASFLGSLEYEEVETFSLTPAYSSCVLEAFGIEFATSVKAGGCVLEFGASGTLSIGGEGCAGDPISYTATFFTAKCTITIGPQALEGVGYENQGEGEERAIVISHEATGLTYTAAGTLCPESGTFNTGIYSGASVLGALNEFEEPRGFWAG